MVQPAWTFTTNIWLSFTFYPLLTLIPQLLIGSQLSSLFSNVCLFLFHNPNIILLWHMFAYSSKLHSFFHVFPTTFLHKKWDVLLFYFSFYLSILLPVICKWKHSHCLTTFLLGLCTLAVPKQLKLRHNFGLSGEFINLVDSYHSEKLEFSDHATITSLLDIINILFFIFYRLTILVI